MTWIREFSVWLLGFVLQPALELPGNVDAAQLQAGIPQGRKEAACLATYQNQLCPMRLAPTAA